MNPAEFLSGGDGGDVDGDGSGNNRSSPWKELQGPRPPSLEVNRDSYKIRKASVALAPHHPPRPPQAPQQPQPVEDCHPPGKIYKFSPKVIHTTVSDFMNLVQRLTGSTTEGMACSAGRPSAPGGAGVGDISPAARFASIEKASPSKDRKVNANSGAYSDFLGDIDVEMGRVPGILSPAPASLLPISPGFSSSSPSSVSSFDEEEELGSEPQTSPIQKRGYSDERVSLPASSSKSTLSSGGGEQFSPIKKKSKISTEDDDDDEAYGLESSKDPTQTVPQRCIEHCKLFLPDCEIEKDKLVQMWIAEECIELEVRKRMEDVANLYFDALVHEEVVIPSKFCKVQRRMKYKVNNSKTSNLLSKQGDDYVRIEAGNLDDICREAIHLTWQCKTLDRTLSDALKNFKQLRTLVVNDDSRGLIKQLPNDIFVGLKLLRTLDLSHTHISELPGSVGMLTSLRYLDMSETPIKKLPESLDRLCFLRTLKLQGCFGLSALPKGMGRLINLRHLDLDIVRQLKSMPRGMGNLIKLQTLTAFIVGKNDRCGIGELKNMNEITGSFCISSLENVSNADEAKEAALGDKKNIDKLELRWHDHVNEDSQDTAEILEFLQPHFELGELQLTFYSGSQLPSWISDPSYTDLASITLYKCRNCDILPSVGELPSLKTLHIVDMENVRNIDDLFCRNHGTQGFKAFPRLEKLTLDNMLNLEEWTGIEDGDFPCLHHISIRYCPKLYGLPSLSHLCSLQHLEISHCVQLMSLPEGLLPGSLESLIIRGCPKINERCRKDGVDWFKISSVKDIWIDFEKIS